MPSEPREPILDAADAVWTAAGGPGLELAPPAGPHGDHIHVAPKAGGVGFVSAAELELARAAAGRFAPGRGFSVAVYANQELVSREAIADPFVRTTVTPRGWRNALRVLLGRFQALVVVDGDPELVEATIALDDDRRPFPFGITPRNAAQAEAVRARLERAAHDLGQRLLEARR